MGELKHTPGPWDQRQRYDTLRDEIGTRGKALATVWVRAIEGVLTHEQSITLTAEGEANARLIAAAPELLEALELVLGNCLDSEGLAAAHAKARAAIAKATGAQP